MKEIQLTQNKVALVDDEDYDILNKYNWCAHLEGNVFYATRCPGKGNYQRMHRVILSPIPSGLEVDHIDGNGLNNQRSNLRIVTRRVNQQNRHINDKKSRYPGIFYSKKDRVFIARIRIHGERRFLGYFKNEIEAANQYKHFADTIEISRVVKMGGCCND